MESKTVTSPFVKYVFLLPFLLLAEIAFPQSIEAIKLGNWDDTSIPLSIYGDRYNDVWGVVVNGVEYGIIGSTNGAHFIDINNPSGPTEVAFVLGGSQGTSIVHRDYHSYQHYLYAVADEGSNSTLQIIDFSGLPDGVEIVYDSNEFFTRRHNIFIDEENARLYTSNGIDVLSLADPAQPVFLDRLSTNGLPVPGYSHDIFVRDNILYMNCQNNGLYIVDYNDVDNPVVLGSMTDYPQSGYNHSGWLSDDGSHYFLCDETHGTDVKSVSVADFTDIHVVDLFNAGSSSPSQIPHNAMVKDDLLFVSYYYDGLQVFDISDPESVIHKYHYDTYPGINNESYKGAWGIYALLPSGRILISDINSGLYVFELPADIGLYTNEYYYDICLLNGAETISFDLLLGDDFDANGTNVTVDGVPTGVLVDFEGDLLAPGSKINVMVSGLSAANNFDLTFTASDGTVATSQSIQLNVAEMSVSISIGIPTNGSTEISLTPNFFWPSLNGVAGVVLEICTSPDFEPSSIVVSEMVSGSNFSLPDELLPGTTYYWRLISREECAGSEVFSFTTAGEAPVNTFTPDRIDFWVFPNPASITIHLQIDSSDNKPLDVQLVDITGKVVQEWQLNAQAQIILQLSPGLSGLYLLSVKSEKGLTTKRVMIE